MTTDLEINLPCTKHTDGAANCLATLMPETEQQVLLDACDSCKAGYTIQSLLLKIRELEARPKPLLICATCKNTETVAGALARRFNHARCMHCGGLFLAFKA